MSLIIPFDPGNLDPKVASALDDIIAPLQTWAGKVDGFGKTIDVPYATSLFGVASGGAWTVTAGQMRSFKYAIFQDWMAIRVTIVGSTTAAGMGAVLHVRVPGDYKVPDNTFLGFVQWNADTAGLEGVGKAFPSSEGRTIRILRDVFAASTAWPSSDAGLNIQFNFMFPVIPTA